MTRFFSSPGQWKSTRPPYATVLLALVTRAKFTQTAREDNGAILNGAYLSAVPAPTFLVEWRAGARARQPSSNGDATGVPPGRSLVDGIAPLPLLIFLLCPNPTVTPLLCF